MNAPSHEDQHTRFLAETHAVENVSRELADYNLYAEDRALRDAVQREGAAWAEADLQAFGSKVGAADYLQLGFAANRYPPEFDTHDRFGNRVDLVSYHPAYHSLMDTALSHGLHSSPWTDPRPGAHVARAAHSYLHGQVEAGHGCPITMTFACIPSIRSTPAIAALWEPKITAREYDPRNVPDRDKGSVTIGMGMTEKQGGSDVRSNSTRAYPVGQRGPGELYELVGHKFFLSAPMCDAFLVLAQTEAGPGCFLVPRWRPDGSKNPLQVLRLKKKLSNASNASSEIELRGAMGWLLGEEGRGVRTIVEMVSLTRFDCMIGSAAGMRMAVSQALHHCSIREAFGAVLNRQPLMQNVLADLAIESEAALVTGMRMARALDNPEDEQEALLMRLGVAVGKYWICKRTPNHAYEAMECIGGSGLMEDSIMPRLYREAPVNAIWEGSGNVQCLDVLRALQKSPQVVEAFFNETGKARGANTALDRQLDTLAHELNDPTDMEYRARSVVDRLATSLQAALLLQHSPSEVADAYCASRLEAAGHHNCGALPRGIDCASIIERATPQA
ncbi:acyl-CoA dehydrogenase family protein [Haliea sp. E1-2-M8]|uniref:acyl-CoA dehydrogenase family protein n=1 Tax=Haliea sp. E1-2-M8 TaxID=3064706 RepID=UPI0027232562|nr:acyl-CoA dehydrogenase family protein [Haliea sp. E1-2-M8]MDO8863519.1 acyl-CoA dehydrogenase family protein [Haliea sp. E1-2-M8]